VSTAIREQDAAKEAEASKRARSLQVLKSRMRGAVETLVEKDDTQKLKHAEMEHEEVLDFAAIQDIARAERRKVAAKNDVEDLLAEIDEINAGKARPMTAHERQVSELQQQVVALKVVSEKKDVEIERVATLFRATVQKVATLDSGLQEMAKTNIALKVESEKKDAKIAELQVEVSQKDAKIAELQVEVSQKDAKIAELQVEVSQKDAKIAELQVEVSQKDVEVSCATNDMATAAQRVVTLDTELKQMGEINSNLAADLAHVTEEWETLQEDILEQKR
jgi:chromosome segregation ATPase